MTAREENLRSTSRQDSLFDIRIAQLVHNLLNCVHPERTLRSMDQPQMLTLLGVANGWFHLSRKLLRCTDSIGTQRR